MTVFLILLLQAETDKPSVVSPELLTMLGLILAFGIETTRRIFQRRWDKIDAATKEAKDKAERLEEKAERVELENEARKQREEIAAKIKDELSLQYGKQALERDKAAFELLQKLESQDESVRELDKKVVTLQVADGHKDEIKHVIEQNIEATKEGTAAAHEAFEVANTINQKLEKMSERGLLTQKQEGGRDEIDQIDDKKEADEKADKKK